LNLTFAPTNPPVVRLTNGVPYQGITDGKPSYFYIDVPLEATVSFNRLTTLGQPLRLLYNENGLPDGGAQPGDVVLLGAVADTGIAVVTTTQPPILPRGQRYYLEVRSLPSTATNAFEIQVDLNVPITPLANNVPLAVTNLAGGREDFFSFDVSAGAISVSFEVTGATQDVDLYLSPSPDLPRPTQSAYSSRNFGLQDERIVITGQTQPVPLRPGRWYVGVFNPGTNAANYTVVARESVSALIALTNDVPIRVNNAVGERFDYYYIDVDPGVISGRFELRGLTGEADLYLRHEDPLPSTSVFDYASINDGIVPDVLVVSANDLPVAMQPGRWLVGVRVRSGSPMSYELLASILYPSSELVELLEQVPDVRSGAAPGRTDYRFSVFTAVPGVRFELSGLDGPADLFVARGTLPRVALRSFSALKSGSTTEVVIITTNEVPDLAVDWYLTVERPGGGATGWTVVARSLTDVTLPTGVPGRIVPPASPGDPYLLEWSVEYPNALYQVETTSDLSLTPVVWVPLGPPLVGDQSVLSVPLTNFTDAFRFYRITLTPQP